MRAHARVVLLGKQPRQTGRAHVCPVLQDPSVRAGLRRFPAYLDTLAARLGKRSAWLVRMLQQAPLCALSVLPGHTIPAMDLHPQTLVQHVRLVRLIPTRALRCRALVCHAPQDRMPPCQARLSALVASRARIIPARGQHRQHPACHALLVPIIPTLLRCH